MTPLTKRLEGVLREAESWPEEMQEELADAASEIAAGLTGEYRPTEDELAGIRRGLDDADRGRFGSDDDVAAAFAAFRRK